MAKRDYYEVLGVQKDASADEIRILAIRKPKKNSRKQPRLTKS